MSESAREGLEHLQAAAKEMIAATRAMLDAAEKLVDDPETAAGIMAALRSVAKLAADAVNRPAAGADDDDVRVQHIKVT